MSDFHKYSNTLELNNISELPEISHDKNYSPSKPSNKSLSYHINELQGSLKIMEKQYKSNLKDGFENKIRSFRLQAVMERKILKQTIENAKKNIENQQLKEKMKKAENIRHRQMQGKKSISARKQEKIRKVHSRMESQKKELEEKKYENISIIDSHNKESHDKVCRDFRNRNMKKIYMEGIRKQKQEKEENKLKKQFLEKIITNKETLDKLKNELSLINQPKTKDLFITI